MKTISSIALIVAVSGLACVSATQVAARRTSSSGNAPAEAHAAQQGSGSGAFGAAAADRLTHDTWLLERYRAFADNGMEPSSAGFHLLRPKEDPHWGGMYTVYSTGGWSWWYGPSAKYITEYSMVMVAEETVFASFRRPFLSSTADCAVVDQGDGLFRIDATFTPQGLAVLQTLLGATTGTNTFSDWFGLPHQPGEEVTDMRAVLVSDDIAYQPFSIRDIVLGRISSTVAIATDLTQAESNALVAKL